MEQALRHPKSQVGFGTSKEAEGKPKEVQLPGAWLVLCSLRQPRYEDLKYYSNLTYSAPDTRHREQTSVILRVLGCGGKAEKLIFFLDRTQLCWSILFEKKCKDLARKSSQIKLGVGMRDRRGAVMSVSDGDGFAVIK